MTTTVRSCLTAGVSVLTATAIAFVPSVAAPAPHPTAASAPIVRVVEQPIELTASVQSLSTPMPTLLSDWLQSIRPSPPSANAQIPTKDPRVVLTPNGIDNLIKNAYYAIEPWVEYAFEWVAYGVGWIPYVGWLSPQVMIFYRLGESIVQSITFNIADWLGGSISFWHGLGNVGRDTVDAFIRFGGEQWNFWLPNIPRPPWLPGTLAATTAKEAAPGPLGKLADVLSPALTGAEAPVIHNPLPITRKLRYGRLATFLQRITDGATSAGRTSVDIKSLGTLGQLRGVAGDQTRPKARDLAGKVRSAVRNLASSAPHPVRDRIAAAAAKAKTKGE